MFNFLKKILGFHSPTKARHLKRQIKKSNLYTQKRESFPKEIILDKPKHEILAKVPATVLINFINEQNEELKPKMILKSYLGNPIKLTIPQFNNYLFKRIDGISSTVTSTKQTITIHYQKKLGNPIAIYCFDYDNHQLLQIPKFLTGALTATYQIQIPDITGYESHLAIGQLSGKFTSETQNIVLYYRHKNWEFVQPVNYLVQIKTKAPVYQQPNEKHNYEFTLPVGSVWKVFKKIQINNQIWLSLGGAEWIKQDYTSPLTQQPKQLN